MTHGLAAQLRDDAAGLHERHLAELNENGWALSRERVERAEYLVRHERALAEKERVLRDQERSKALVAGTSALAWGPRPAGLR